MSLDWRDIKARKIPIIKARDSEGNLLAVALANTDYESQHWYGCPWENFAQIGDLSCGSRYYDDHRICPVDNEGDEPSLRSQELIELDIRRTCSSLQAAMIGGISIGILLVKLETLQLEMRTRIDFDVDQEMLGL